MSGRAVSGVERLWLVADRLAPPFVNQLVLEGEGTVDFAALEAAVEALGRWSVCSARRIGALARARGAPGGPPRRLRRVEAPGWDGRGGERAPFLSDPLPSAGGPICEVLAVVGDVPRLVVRTHHAFADGRGTLELVAALFAQARGEAPAPIPLAGPTDAELARRVARLSEPPVPRNCAPPLPIVDDAPGLVWRRATAPLDPRGLLPRLAHALGCEADPSARCRVDVPVDLRRHAPGLRSAANLTGLVRLSVDRHRDRPDPVARIDAELRRRLDRAEEAGFVLAAERLRRVPLGWMERVAAGRPETGLFGATANLSNVGRLDLDACSGAGFRARAGFFVPPGAGGLPLFLALTGGPGGVELCATMPARFGGEPALAALLDRLVAAVQEDR